jgi:hypothetical protein
VRRHPVLYEANARLLLGRLSKKLGRTLTLGSIPTEEWRELARKGFDLLWLMGVWRRSPAARGAALTNQGLRQAYSDSLPDWKDADVGGSPYAIYEYELEPSLGPASDLPKLRDSLNKAGLGLVLDFVPNHLAMDHPWTRTLPGTFVQQTNGAFGLPPDGTFKTPEGLKLAHGRDPNFPPWGDTVQVNYFSAEARRSMQAELRRISSFCDGVRCDMAMLALNKVFERVWGPLLPGERPQAEFWHDAIEAVRGDKPSFLFLAEAYWDHEWELQQLGFDFTYDKTLYDRLRHQGAPEVLAHLKPDGPYQDRSAHFVENHDEPRAVSAFGRERSLAAAAISMTAPGLRFFHEGQLEGRRTKVPIQLNREPVEPVDAGVSVFYGRLLDELANPALHDGRWQALDVAPARDDGSHVNLLVWSWALGDRRRLVAVNYSPNHAAGRVPDLPAPIELEPWGVRFLN